MGKRQQGFAGLVALALVGCGGSSARPKDPGPTPEADAGADEAAQEAAQIQAISGALNEFSPAVHTCWARGAADDVRLEGQVVLAVDIGEGGASDVEVVEDSAQDPVLTECLQSLWGSYQWPSVFAAGDRIQLPPFDFVAPLVQYSVALAHVEPRESGTAGITGQVLLDQKNSGNGQASLTVLSVSPGAEEELHTHPSAELLFVLQGQGVVRGPGAPQTVKAGSAVYIPKGTPHAFAAGDAPVEVVQFYAPGGPESRFRDSSSPVGTDAVAGKARGTRPTVREASESKAYPIAGGKAEIRILLDEQITKKSAAYIGALTAQPGTAIPEHRHGDSSEYLFVLEGAAAMEVAGTALRVHAGDAIQIPKNALHKAEILGPETFKALQFYAPAGPGQRFKGSAPTATRR